MLLGRIVGIAGADGLLSIMLMAKMHLLQETWAELEKLVDQGLVKTLGISNFSVVKTKEVQGFARIQPAVNQVEIHPYWRNDKLWEFAQSSGVRLILIPAAALCLH